MIFGDFTIAIAFTVGAFLSACVKREWGEFIHLTLTVWLVVFLTLVGLGE